jgi:hypothetical protein
MEYYEQIRKIEELLIGFNLVNASAIQDIICDDSSLENEFFKKVNTVDWFNWLEESKYFIPSKIKYDKNGIAFFWNVLEYLERVSKQLDKNPQFGDKLIGILDKIYQFSQTNKPINNLHIWWYCSKILFNIPFDIIKKNLPPEEFRCWFLEWAKYSELVISDVGTKLLPKFLNENSAIGYAEVIIDVLTEVRADQKQVSFFNLKDAALAWDYYWVSDAFEKNPLIGEKCSLAAIFKIADKLKITLQYKQQVQYEIFQIKDIFYRIEVSRIPVEGLSPGEIRFEDYSYNCTVSQYSSDQIKEGDGSQIRDLHNIVPAIPVGKTFKINTINKDDFVIKLMAGLPQEINWESAENFKINMGQLFKNLHSDYSFIHFKSLMNDERYSGNTAEEVLTVILRNILLIRFKANLDDGKKLLDELLGNKYQFPIFRRFALLAIDKQWKNYSKYFNSFIKVVPNAFEGSHFEVELYDLLLNHNSDFNPALINKIKEQIRTIPEYYKKIGDKQAAYWQFKWLSPLRDNPAFSAWYKETEKKIEKENAKPYEPERSTISIGMVENSSPKTTNELIEMPVLDIVKYLQDFKGPEGPVSIFEGKPNKEGLSDALHGAVKEDPKKYVDQIEAFSAVEEQYLIKLFRGLRDAWKAGKDFDWKKVLDFVPAALVKRTSDTLGDWLLSEIVELIGDGCRSDTHAFDPDLFEITEKVFDGIFPLLRGEEHPDIKRDALMYAMNTPFGRTIMAYVTFSLRAARTTKKKTEGWGDKKYQRFLAVGIEAYIWLGCYLPQIKYLDESYAKRMIASLREGGMVSFEWRMFMEGYLHTANVYQDLHVLMREHCLKALENAEFTEEANNRLVEYVCLGYLYLNEPLHETREDGQPSLFRKMLMDNNAISKKERWLRAVGFFTNREAKSSSKMMEFWKWTYDERKKVETILGDDYKLFLGKMSGLTKYIDIIDGEKKEWLLLCAPFVGLHQNAMFFLEAIAKFDDEVSLKSIGEIFPKVLENTTPLYMQENIIKVVTRLYEKGFKEQADAICNTYGRRGIHFLRELWEKNQPQKEISYGKISSRKRREDGSRFEGNEPGDKAHA